MTAGLISPARHIAAMFGVVALATLASPANAAEEILSYDAAVIVQDDGDLDVTETIRVRAEGSQIQRGIFRDFPLVFVDTDGRRRKVTFDLIDVTRDGQPEPHHTRSNANGIRIYAGEEETFLDPGVYTYQFHYETGRQLRFLPEHTELFWNVTGNFWDFPIQTARAEIVLPQGRAPLRWTAYTGDVGARGEDFTGRILGNNALDVATTRPLPPGEGLSVVVQLPTDLIAPPSGGTAAYYWYLDNRRYLFGGFGLLGIIIFYLMTWNAVGRDPPKGTIIPLFYPPDGISPALAGYVNDWGWGNRWRTFTAAALSLAVKGLLVFDDSSDKIVLARKKAEDGGAVADPETLPPGERAILHWLDGRGGPVTIDKANGKSLKSALSKFQSAIEGENRHRFFQRNTGWFILGVALTVAALVLVLVFGDLTEGEIGLLIATCMLSVFAGAVIASLIRAFAGARRGARSVVGLIIRLASLVFFLGMTATIVAPIFQSLPDDFGRTLVAVFLENGFPFVLVGSFAAMNGLFYYLLRAPTAAGRRVMDDIEGLELYIRTAETPRFNAAGAPDLDTTQFERLLPYAVALDAEKPWSEAFAKAFARAHPGEDVAHAYAPAWHGGHGWRSGDFSKSVSSAVSSAQSSFASAMPAPKSSSSGFSGGGSGGGGGGGGGGGW